MNKNYSKIIITDFTQARGWDGNEMSNTYNFLLNLSEEIGEIWNCIKWSNSDEDVQKLIEKNREELKNGIGDSMWLIYRLALIFDVNPEEAFDEVIAEYRERFPIEKVKGKHGNVKLGGYDGKSGKSQL